MLAKTKNKVSVPRGEYQRLKNLDRRFGAFWSYFEYLLEIKKARQEITGKRVTSQEKLFERLGL